MLRTKSFECRACGHLDEHEVFLSFGSLPLGNSLITEKELSEPDRTHPLELAFCRQCSLIQIADAISLDELIEQNLYFTSSSPALLHHGDRQAQWLIDARNLNDSSLVVEIGSNDGTLLDYFRKRNIRVLGVEPTAHVADVGERKYGVPAIKEVFTDALSQRLNARGMIADVIIANYVLELIPNLGDFVRGIGTLLAPNGVALIEVPYVRSMIEQCRFDGIAHLRLSWFSLTSIDRLFRRNGLGVVDAELLPEFRGGTLRFLASKSPNSADGSVETMLGNESDAGIDALPFYRSFAQRVHAARQELRDFALQAKGQGKKLAAYGAGIKASTLLNFVALDGKVVDFVADGNTYKHGRYMPGVRLPIGSPQRLVDEIPDYTLLLALDFADEILAQQAEYRRRGGKFVIPVPHLEVV